jgi:2-polyprenyl-6-hydroxyphenyl methylase/3-demethylubiquinone-9 3-methyltransferase
LLLQSLARLGARAHGIDATASNIPIALHHASQDPSLPLVGASGPATDGASLSYEHTTAEDLLLRRRAECGAGNEGYDVVCAMEVIEHVAGPGDFLRSLAQLVRPGGHLFLSTIARTPLSYFLTILVAEDVLGLVSKGTHTHSQYINPTELDAFFTHEIPWLGQKPRDELDARTPHKMRSETRGVAYIPWRGAWELSPDWAKEWKTEQGNYFYYIRRPLEDA